MANIFNVARYILEKKGEMSVWKLQKLCYYSQVYHMVWENQPLFQEDFVAGCNGPICKELYKEHKGKFLITFSDIPKCLENGHLSEKEADSIDGVLNYLGDLQPYELREYSHGETPWIEARGDTPEGVSCDVIISKDRIKAYYNKKYKCVLF